MNIDRLLVVVAHPDDESIMCGGTISKCADKGIPVLVFCMADGVGSRTGGVINIDAYRERHGQFRRACKILGTENAWIRSYHDNQMDKYPLLQVIQDIESHVQRFNPDTVITHWSHDLNVDHRVVSEATITACRPKTGVRNVLLGETLSSTEHAITKKFEPNVFVSIDIEKKLQACSEYIDEIKDKQRSIEAIKALSVRRGSECCTDFAEVFHAYRMYYD